MNTRQNNNNPRGAAQSAYMLELAKRNRARARANDEEPQPSRIPIFRALSERFKAEMREQNMAEQAKRGQETQPRGLGQGLETAGQAMRARPPFARRDSTVAEARKTAPRPAMFQDPQSVFGELSREIGDIVRGGMSEGLDAAQQAAQRFAEMREQPEQGFHSLMPGRPELQPVKYLKSKDKEFTDHVQQLAGELNNLRASVGTLSMDERKIFMEEFGITPEVMQKELGDLAVYVYLTVVQKTADFDTPNFQVGIHALFEWMRHPGAHMKNRELPMPDGLTTFEAGKNKCNALPYIAIDEAGYDAPIRPKDGGNTWGMDLIPSNSPIQAEGWWDEQYDKGWYNDHDWEPTRPSGGDAAQYFGLIVNHGKGHVGVSLTQHLYVSSSKIRYDFAEQSTSGLIIKPYLSNSKEKERKYHELE